MLKILGLKAYILTALVAAVIAGAGSFGLAWKLQDGNIEHLKRVHAEEQVQAVNKARAQERAAAQLSASIGAKAAASQIKIRTVTRTVIREVPKHVSPEADTRCVLPVGFVRVLNAPAAGVDVASVPHPTGEPDDAPSGVACSEVAATVADWAGTYREVADELKHLQDWVAAQGALADGPAPPLRTETAEEAK